MRVAVLGQGAREALTEGASGSILAWFPRACYLNLPEGIATLVTPDVSPGPIHAVVDSMLPRLEPGTPVAVAGGHVQIGGHRVDLSEARTWRGELPDPRRIVEAAHPTARIAEAAAGSSSLLVDPYRGRASEALELLRKGNLHGAAELLVGLGPGLTPAGDDALAGALFAASAAGSRTRSLLDGVARVGHTGPVPRSFLRWAARGQALLPAHDLLAAAASGDEAKARNRAEKMAEIGETSGADFLLGLSWWLDAA